MIGGHRIKGKGYNRSRRMNNNGSKARSSRGSRRAHPSSPGGAFAGGGMDDQVLPEVGATGWPLSKKRRLLYGALAAIIGIVGISFIAYWATKERKYNQTKQAVYDDYFYNDDVGALDGEEEVDVENEETVYEGTRGFFRE